VKLPNRTLRSSSHWLLIFKAYNYSRLMAHLHSVILLFLQVWCRNQTLPTNQDTVQLHMFLFQTSVCRMGYRTCRPCFVNRHLHQGRSLVVVLTHRHDIPNDWRSSSFLTQNPPNADNNAQPNYSLVFYGLDLVQQFQDNALAAGYEAKTSMYYQCGMQFSW
jgi:hypothetical protein